MGDVTICRAAMALALLAPMLAWAGAREEVDAAIAKFAGARSFSAAMDTGGTRVLNSRTDFIAPDRYRMTLPDGRVQVVVDGTMYVEGEDGVRSVRIPPEVLARWRERTRITGLGDGMQATDLGEDVIDGASTRKYGISRPGTDGSTMTMWIGVDGYPLQVRAPGVVDGQPVTTTIRYSRFNDPTLAIAPPR